MQENIDSWVVYVLAWFNGRRCLQEFGTFSGRKRLKVPAELLPLCAADEALIVSRLELKNRLKPLSLSHTDNRLKPTSRKPLPHKNSN